MRSYRFIAEVTYNVSLIVAKSDIFAGIKSCLSGRLGISKKKKYVQVLNVHIGKSLNHSNTSTVNINEIILYESDNIIMLKEEKIDFFYLF